MVKPQNYMQIGHVGLIRPPTLGGWVDPRTRNNKVANRMQIRFKYLTYYLTVGAKPI